MRFRKGFAAVAVGGALSLVAGAGTASAAFPDFSDCPRSTPDISGCFDVQSVSGSLTIKGFTVPLGTSFELRGALAFDASRPGGYRFVPPAGKTGIFAKPVQVPGGLLGIDFPIPGNAVTATAKLAGPTSGIAVDLSTFTVSLPIKLSLTNPIIGPGCQIGSDNSPVRLTLIVGTTAPPPPARPISGRVGTPTIGERYITIAGSTNVDNTFSVPGASGCGIGLGLINSIVNLKLGLPSAAGNNEIIVTNNVALGGLNG
jgi:hypothetical protein